MDFRSPNNINGLPPHLAGLAQMAGQTPHAVPDGVKPSSKTAQRSPGQMNHPPSQANAMDNAEHAANEENAQPDEQAWTDLKLNYNESCQIFSLTIKYLIDNWI